MTDGAHTAALLADLTEPQAAAVQHMDGPLLVLAGAGAGKTRVITRRAAYLAHAVPHVGGVLAITFTNKAANEMQERIGALGAAGSAGLVAPITTCTFHAFCARMLRIHHDRAGVPGDFTVFDSADQRKVIKDAVARAGLPSDNWRPAQVQTVISKAKNAMLTAEAFSQRRNDWTTQPIGRIYTAYEQILSDQHGLDFDDLLFKLAVLLRDDPDLRQRIERRYTHVLIDEYQDTNMAQYEIAHLITEQNCNLCATGDPDQSIYAWRGADITNILRFEEDHPDAKVVRLEQNYRSTKRILSAASAMIQHNMGRKEKSLWTHNLEGPNVCVVRAPTAEAEARFLANEILERRDRGEDLSDVAIFYRTNALSRAVEEALLTAGIAYQVARGVEFYNRKEIKDVLAYVRVLVNPHDEVSLIRIINTPARGIGKKTVDRLIVHARATGATLRNVVRNPNDVASLNKRAIAKIAFFAEILESLEPLIEAPPADALKQILSKSGLFAHLSQQADFDREPLDNTGELINAAVSFEKSQPGGTLLDWLQYTCLLGDVDAIDEGGGVVTLMTLHAAKGLEFPVVYIVALEEGLLPFCRDERDPDCDEEEERRLCFVGMTRAKHNLTLSYCQYRMTRGSDDRKMRSRFICELPADEVLWVDAPDDSPDSGVADDRHGRLPDDMELWEPGTLVRHPMRGLGKILWIQPNGAHSRAAVLFKDDGTERTFILRHAGLERVDFHEVDFD